MRIAIVYDLVYPFSLGGGEKRNWEVARSLAADGHDVTIVGMDYWGGGPLQIENVTLLGACAAQSPFNAKGKRSFTQPLKFAWGVFGVVRRGDFDLVETCNFPYLSCLAARLARPVRGHLSVCWFEVRGLRGWIRYQGAAGIIAWAFELITGKLTRFNTAISSLTQERGRRLLRLSSGRLELIPCGVNYQEFHRHADLPKQEQLLYVGRLVRHKRVDLAIRSLLQLRKKFPSLQLKIVGTGDYAGELRNLCAALDLAESVIFVDKLDLSDLQAEFARARVFVFPSEQEGFGIVMVEAMAAGTPVVALRAQDSAARTVIRHGWDGFLADGLPTLTEYIDQLLSDPAVYERIRQNAFATAQSYDWKSSVVPRLLQHYRRAASCE